jgi:hypothetical protein
MPGRYPEDTTRNMGAGNAVSVEWVDDGDAPSVGWLNRRVVGGFFRRGRSADVGSSSHFREPKQKQSDLTQACIIVNILNGGFVVLRYCFAFSSSTLGLPPPPQIVYHSEAPYDEIRDIPNLPQGSVSDSAHQCAAIRDGPGDS